MKKILVLFTSLLFASIAMASTETASTSDVGLAAPTDLQGQAVDGGARLTWDAPRGAAGYNVYHNDTYKDTVFSTAYTHQASAGIHKYYVTAFDASRTNFSEKSNSVSVEVENASNPQDPSPTNNSGFGYRSDSDPAGTLYQNQTEGDSQKPHNRPLGHGYFLNWYVEIPPWKGPIKSSYQAPEVKGGSNFWVEWNNNNEGGEHAETDIRISKSAYEAARPNGNGYPSKIKDIQDMPVTYEGQWTRGSKGRAHINMTAWITDGESRDDSKRIDVIIHAWDNSGNLKTNSTFHDIGDITHNGVLYDVIARVGDRGEAASYNIVPVTERTTDPLLPYPLHKITGEFDVKVFLDWIIRYHDDTVMTDEWYVHDLEWTVTGQSRQTTDGVDIPASEGRWTFLNYSIPNLIE